MKKSRNLILAIIGAFVVVCGICGLISVMRSGSVVERAAQTTEPEAAMMATETLAPTEMPIPTEPPPSPTPMPEPINLSGVGDSIQDLNKWAGPAIVWAKKNAAASNFVVMAYDEQGEMAGLLVNVLDPYEGETWLPAEATRLEIKAVGDWSIGVVPVSLGRKLPAVGSVEGSGDSVFVIEGEPDTARIRGNAAASNFVVMAYDQQGEMTGLLVNVLDPYEGQVLVPKSARYLVVQAVGPWSMVME